MEAMTDDISLMPGDHLRVERRFLIDGVVSWTTSEGEFAGVERLGSSEHLAIKGEGEEVRLMPLTSVSEIIVVKKKARMPDAEGEEMAPTKPAWDPGVA